ncbi:MAG: hypothetical protein WD401_00175 [Thermomicrobiaceae bacterium]
MNPNRLTRELRKLPGNIRSPDLPGGTLISAVLDRRLMAWSDRGGASRIFGDIWSEHCWAYLTNGSSLFTGITGSEPAPIILRLDDNPKIAIQAGRNKLPNPDFLVLTSGQANEYVVRAVDAKFAVDRLRRTQIGPESIRDLIELPGSLAREEIVNIAGESAIEQLSFQPGMFLGPNSLLNDYFYQQLTTGDAPQIPVDELKLLTVDADALYSRIEEHQLMSMLQSIDGLIATSPESEIVLGMYYLRLSSAARWFETQARQPLLAVDEIEPVDIDQVLDSARNRVQPGISAYGLIEEWSEVAERSVERKKHVSDAARLPTRMSEIRALVERRKLDDQKKAVRIIRGTLEKQFARRLVETVGVIPSEPAEPLDEIVERVRTESRNLRKEMLQEARAIAERLAESSDDASQPDS